jgi:hypothetical protein
MKWIIEELKYLGDFNLGDRRDGIYEKISQEY